VVHYVRLQSQRVVGRLFLASKRVCPGFDVVTDGFGRVAKTFGCALGGLAKALTRAGDGVAHGVSEAADCGSDCGSDCVGQTAENTAALLLLLFSHDV